MTRPSLIKKLLVVETHAAIPKCTRCFAELNLMHGNGPPGVGDFNVCAHCYCVMRIVDESLALRPATATEIMELRCAGDLSVEDADRLLLFFSAGEPRT